MFARSHGISCTSFLVYSPDLPIQVTIAFLDFAVFGQLVPCTRLNIRFLFVEPRFRYVFLSVPLTEVSFDSRYRVHRQQVPQGNCTPDVQHARRTKKTVIVFRSQPQEIWRFFLCIGDRSLCDEMIVLSVFNFIKKFCQFLFVDLDHHDVFFIESSLQFLNKLFDRFPVFRQRLFIDSVRS